jgi:hypothetical protein
LEPRFRQPRAVDQIKVHAGFHVFRDDIREISGGGIAIVVRVGEVFVAETRCAEEIESESRPERNDYAGTKAPLVFSDEAPAFGLPEFIGIVAVTSCSRNTPAEKVAKAVFCDIHSGVFGVVPNSAVIMALHEVRHGTSRFRIGIETSARR